MTEKMSKSMIHGEVAPGFVEVKAEFEGNFKNEGRESLFSYLWRNKCLAGKARACIQRKMEIAH